MSYNERREKLIGQFEEKGIDVLLVTSLPHQRYLTGYSGSHGIAVIAPRESFFITDFRYKEQSEGEVEGCTIVICEKDLLSELAQLNVLQNGMRIGFESDHLIYGEYQKIKELLPEVDLVATRGMIEGLITVKEEEEIDLIREAVRISDEAFSEVLHSLKPGAVEREIAAELEYIMRKKGGSGASFGIIVASGFRAALPHGVASDRKMERGDLVILDFGTVYQGYCSDLTRTVVIGRATGKQRQVYDVVLKAQLAALLGVRAGITASELDGMARRAIDEAGYGPQFGHALGHGVGLSVHESPGVSAKNHELLQEGMVITIEPGIYIPEWGGVRIEDMVVVREEAGEILTKSPKEFLTV